MAGQTLGARQQWTRECRAAASRRGETLTPADAILGAGTCNGRRNPLSLKGFRRPFSSRGRTRTYDPTINSRLLYQLSYAGMLASDKVSRSTAGRQSLGAG